MSQERNIFSPNKNIQHQGYFIARNCFIADITFKNTEQLKTDELKNFHSIITDD